MAKFYALARTSENHRMLADNIAAAQGGETDASGHAGAGVAFAAAHGGVGQVDIAARRRRPPQAEGGARWRVDFAAMVHFHDFNIESGV